MLVQVVSQISQHVLAEPVREDCLRYAERAAHERNREHDRDQRGEQPNVGRAGAREQRVVEHPTGE